MGIERGEPTIDAIFIERFAIKNIEFKSIRPELAGHAAAWLLSHYDPAVEETRKKKATKKNKDKDKT